MKIFIKWIKSFFTKPNVKVCSRKFEWIKPPEYGTPSITEGRIRIGSEFKYD